MLDVAVWPERGGSLVSMHCIRFIAASSYEPDGSINSSLDTSEAS